LNFIPKLKSLKLDNINMHDANLKVKKLLNVNMPPATFLVAPGGEIIYRHNSYTKGDEKHLEEEIEKYLKSVNETEKTSGATE